ncbi:hypothetical protein FRC18_009189 [Serendipita sp. 400]|nr:hypothetical protein FRC18_009189 [Serendipita sp. 400]
MIRYKRIVPITANGAQNAYNPLPNGNGVPAAPVNTTAANPPPPPPPPPQPEPEKSASSHHSSCPPFLISS